MLAVPVLDDALFYLNYIAACKSAYETTSLAMLLCAMLLDPLCNEVDTRWLLLLE